jgi:hypothetical protein
MRRRVLTPWLRKALQLGVAALLVVLLGGCRSSTAPARRDPPASASPEDRCRPARAATRSSEAIAAEFRELRARRHRTSPTRGDDDLDAWGGRMHVVMDELLAHAGVPGTPRASVIAIMDEPDEVDHPGSQLWGYAKSGHWKDASNDASEMLVYYWRGGHDFLYFFMRDDRVVCAGWWMAGE